MRIRRKIVTAFIAAMVLMPAAVSAQSSSINTFSPYSLYGLGNLSTQGNANLRSMGGVGAGYRDSYLNPYSVSLNYLNPASYSAIPQKAFIFNFEVEGQNYFLKDASTKSSYNSFNIRDIGVLFPLAKRVGFSVSVTPYSSVGYRMERTLDDDQIVGDIGDVKFKYEGDGDVTQLKAGLGFQLFKDFSIGAEMVYYFGKTNRTQVVQVRSLTGGGSYTSTSGYLNEDISKITMNIGFQYSPITTVKRMLTIGGTYTMGSKLKPEKTYTIPANDYASSNYVWHSNSINKRFEMADVFTVGAFYQTSKLGAGIDYSFANWGRNKEKVDDMRYVNTNTIKTGVQFTPDRFDVRRFFNRLTYRAGFRYEEGYMSFAGKKLKDKAVSVGVGVPVKMASLSNINVGLEYGQRGSTRGSLVKESYFKFSIGLSLFGEDYWFRKQKYD